MRNIVASILVLVVTAACSSMVNNKADSPVTEAKDHLASLNKHEQELVDADRSFSYALFRHIIQAEENGNIFVSPLSVSVALGMTLNGAKGQTAEAMKKTLALQGLSMNEINTSYSTLIELLENADPAVKMKLANSIWIRQGYPVKQSFQETGREYFDARIEELDFDNPASVDIMNQWVSDHTNELIKSIIEGPLPKEVSIYLIITTYFKGDWQMAFDPEVTQSREFTMEDGTAEKTEMMSQKDTLAAYVSDDVQLLDLPYGNGLYSMTLLMPADKEVPINSFVENKLTADHMEDWLSSADRKKTKISLPKFEMRYKLRMNDVLADMGMEIAFDPSADFSKIGGDRSLNIDEVMHKSYITVDEEGTEAAAATSVSVELTSVNPNVRTINFNRPFVFLIRERTS